MFPISAPIAFFVDRNGDPLQEGYLYFGEVDQNPETAPQPVYWDKAGTKVAAQPVRTINGYPVRNGSPSQLFIETDHSLTVRDRQQRIVVTALRATDAFGAGSVQTVNLADGAVTSVKLDPDGVELSDGSTGATQPGSDSSDLIATTAQVQAAVTLALTTFLQQKVYPVGAAYVSFTNLDNPNITLGFGSWTQVAGRTIVGYDNSQVEFDALLETGGAKTHTLTEAELATHNHLERIASGGGGTFAPYDGGGTEGTTIIDGNIDTADAGSNTPHNNLQPYIVAAIWRRTA